MRRLLLAAVVAALAIPAVADAHATLAKVSPPTQSRLDAPPKAVVLRFDQAVSDTGLLERAKGVHLTPYQVLVVASIVQAEGRTKDFPKIARAILNRLDKGMRLQLNSRIHPMGEMTFNPAARPGDPDWRVMYIGAGDSGAGEQRDSRRANPQRLDTLVGKILRILPDLRERTATSTVSDNGRYRVPNDNPFVSIAGAKKEIWAYGVRNPHRMSWDVDPAHPRDPRLFAFNIGLAMIWVWPLNQNGLPAGSVSLYLRVGSPMASCAFLPPFFGK